MGRHQRKQQQRRAYAASQRAAAEAHNPETYRLTQLEAEPQQPQEPETQPIEPTTVSSEDPQNLQVVTAAQSRLSIAVGLMREAGELLCGCNDPAWQKRGQSIRMIVDMLERE